MATKKDLTYLVDYGRLWCWSLFSLPGMVWRKIHKVYTVCHQVQFCMFRKQLRKALYERICSIHKWIIKHAGGLRWGALPKGGFWLVLHKRLMPSWKRITNNQINHQPAPAEARCRINIAQGFPRGWWGWCHDRCQGRVNYLWFLVSLVVETKREKMQRSWERFELRLCWHWNGTFS